MASNAKTPPSRGRTVKPGYQSQAGYNKLPGNDFALPAHSAANPTANNKYPDQDIAHARDARARVMQHGNAAQQAEVFRRTADHYNGLAKRAGHTPPKAGK